MQSRNDEIAKKKDFNIIINFDEVTGENTQEHNSHWPQIPDHPYRILIIGESGSWKTNALISLISHQVHVNEIFLYVKDPNELKFQFLVNKCEKVGLKN